MMTMMMLILIIMFLYSDARQICPTHVKNLKEIFYSI
jgi:hypothetical protein